MIFNNARLKPLIQKDFGYVESSSLGKVLETNPVPTIQTRVLADYVQTLILITRVLVYGNMIKVYFIFYKNI